MGPGGPAGPESTLTYCWVSGGSCRVTVALFFSPQVTFIQRETASQPPMIKASYHKALSVPQPAEPGEIASHWNEESHRAATAGGESPVTPATVIDMPEGLVQATRSPAARNFVGPNCPKFEFPLVRRGIDSWPQWRKWPRGAPTCRPAGAGARRRTRLSWVGKRPQDPSRSCRDRVGAARLMIDPWRTKCRHAGTSLQADAPVGAGPTKFC